MKDKEHQMLVNLLHQASGLEHCLLDSYLYTASSIKSMPQEFEFLDDGKPNPRRAIQFEKARHWKKAILGVSHEEMLHLHYVQCLLRALDESPSFTLPKRNDKGNWVISNWDIYTKDASADDKNGAEIPLDGLNIEQIKRFILFESTDTLQDANPFGPRISAIFKQLFEFELKFFLEGALFYVDNQKRGKLRDALLLLYGEPAPKVKAGIREVAFEMEPDELKYVRFQSIGDFYMKGVLPLYEQAFDKGLVKNSNLTFNNELLGPDAAEGFLPIGPVYRSKNYTDLYQKNTDNPLKHFKNVRSIVEEIVDEGEGFAGFEEAANNFIAYVKSLGRPNGTDGVREYLMLLKNDQANARTPGYKTPDDLANAQLLRMSHLYRFAIVHQDMLVEQAYTGGSFAVARKKLTVAENNPALRKMVEEMPKQFNAAYLTMLLWLGRIYEVKHWQSDKDRRYAIEMIATWPLMSLAIRPFLEIISFFPVDLTQLFRLKGEALPGLPTDAQQLLAYFNSTERSEAINKEIDYLAMRTLANVAEWASEQIAVIKSSYEGNDRDMIVTRLNGLSRLDEFEKQFPFRMHGGYSNTMPDLTYQQEYSDALDYSEDPSALNSNSIIFNDTLVLRLRFGGFGLVQLSTDPDPPTDESGCTGTHMLHTTDGNKRFDRAQVWQAQPGEQNNILREPRKSLPQIGLMLQDISLMAPADGGAQAGYVPLQVMNSAGAVQTSGVQQVLSISGLNELVRYSAKEIKGNPFRINLLSKNGMRPLGYGENHLVSKDGEPIDPFIISVSDAQFNNLFQREIYNGGKTMRDMNPMQRLQTARWPTGFDGNLSNIPQWLTKNLPSSYMNDVMSGPFAYLKSRATVLNTQLEELLNAPVSGDQGWVDKIASYTERLNLINMPRGTTVGWLTVMLHYGHSVSGDFNLNDDGVSNQLINFIIQQHGLQVSAEPAESDRSKPNSRWVVKYTEGVMDTDAITDLVFGELYIPVKVMTTRRPITFSKTWTFTEGVKEAVAKYTLDFAKPFWAKFTVSKDGKARSTTTTDDGTTFTIKETLVKADTSSYTYSGEGFEGVKDYTGQFSVSTAKDGSVLFTIKLNFSFSDNKDFYNVFKIIGGFFNGVTNNLDAQFSPKQ